MKPSFRSTVLAVFASCVGFVTLADSRWYAKPDGTDDADCMSPATAGSIAAAMAKAAAADGASVITLADGDYDIAALTPVTENSSKAFFVAKKDLTLQSEGGDPANCRLIGGGEEKRSRFLLIPSAASIALKGVTVQGFSTAEGDKNYTGGGAVFANGASVVLSAVDCVFAENSAVSQDGGGAIRGGTVSLSGCTFSDNAVSATSDPAWNGNGGAVYAAAYASVVDCLFEGNVASSKGGALYAGGAGFVTAVSRCVFTANRNTSTRTDNTGAAVATGGGFTFTACTFDANASSAWQGSIVHAGSEAHCYDCVFENTSEQANTLFSTTGRTNVRLHRCKILNNKSQMCASTVLNENCLFVGNGWTTGDKENHLGAGPFYNCTFVGNKSFVSGASGGVFSNKAKLINCIVTADNLVNPSDNYTYYATNCIWNASGKNLLVGVDNITDLANDAAIKFVGLGDNPYAIMLDSPARDKGDNVLGYTAADRDLAGGSRLVRALDIGAYEYQIAAFEAEIEPQVFDGVNGCEPHPVVTDAETQAVLTEGTDYTLSWSKNTVTGMGTMKVTGINGYAGKTADIDFKIVSPYGDGLTFYAKVGGSDDADCVNWATAGSIAAAMAKAAAADGAAVVALEEGEYDIAALEPVAENNSTSFFIAKKDLTIASRNCDPANCRLIGGGEEKRARFLLIPSAASIALKGVTVQGFSTAEGDKNYTGGGAVFANGASVVLTAVDCVFAENSAVSQDGGGAIRGGTVSLSGCTFSDNAVSATSDPAWNGNGGAVYAAAYASVVDCVFERNEASSKGGALYAAGSGLSNALVTNCVFRANRNTSTRNDNQGAAVASTGGFTLHGCTFDGNVATLWGNGILHAGSESHCHDCSFKNASNGSWVLSSNGGAANIRLHRCKIQNFAGLRCASAVLNENCLFVGNGWTTGDRENHLGAGPFYNCTFVGNKSVITSASGGIFSNKAKLVNCIVTADNLVNQSDSFTYYATNCIWNASGKDRLVGEDNNTELANDAAIKFVGAGDDPYAIGKGSPARNTGVNVRGYTKKDRDLAGKRRLCENLLDIGCYEYNPVMGLMLLFR